MRYAVHPNLQGPGYLLDVQSEVLQSLNTRIVVPLLPRADAPIPAARLNPVFTIAGSDYVMVTQFMAAVPLSSLQEPEGSLLAQHDRIVAALDMLFQGF